MAIKAFKTIKEVVGPLMVVENVSGVKFDELVRLFRVHHGDLARG